MGVEYYKGKEVPILEEFLDYEDKLYGLRRDSDTCYIYELDGSYVNPRIRISMKAGTGVRLGLGTEKEFGVWVLGEDATEETFMPLSV